MAKELQKFGKTVELRVYEGTDRTKLVFSSALSLSTRRVTDDFHVPQWLPNSTPLRVDFDIKTIGAYSKAKIDVYNLNDETIERLNNIDADLSMEIWTSLHGGPVELVGEMMALNNAVTVINLPDSVTTLYGFGLGKPGLLDAQLGANAREMIGYARLSQVIDIMVHEAALIAGRGLTMELEFIAFPSYVLNGLVETDPLVGSLKYHLDVLAKEHKFAYHITGKKAIFMFKPESPEGSDAIPLSKLSGIKLNPNNFRSNPLIALGSMSLVVNLEPSYKIYDIIDIGDFVTAAIDVDETTLQHARNVIRSAGGFQKYQILGVDHKGSTHTNAWDTSITAYSPSKGTSMKMGKSDWWKEV